MISLARDGEVAQSVVTGLTELQPAIAVQIMQMVAVNEKREIFSFIRMEFKRGRKKRNMAIGRCQLHAASYQGIAEKEGLRLAFKLGSRTIGWLRGCLKNAQAAILASMRLVMEQ